MGKWFKPTKEDIENIINLYNEGKGIVPISKLYHCGFNKIRKILLENNIKLKEKGGKSPYSFDFNFLDQLNKEEQYYFLGLMYSDGWVLEKENVSGIGLHLKDEELIIKLKNILKSDRPLIYRKDFVILNLTSEYFKNKLIEFGCVPNKSLILKFPEFAINNRFLKDFIRGMFDGDGGITIRKLKNGNYTGTLSFTSTREFNEKLKEILEKELELKHVKLRKSQSSDVTILTINYLFEIIKIMEWMYNNDKDLHLKRKYDKYLKLKKSYETVQDNSLSYKHLILNSKKEEILTRFNNGEFCSSIARSLNLSKSTICRFVKRNNITN